MWTQWSHEDQADDNAPVGSADGPEGNRRQGCVKTVLVLCLKACPKGSGVLISGHWSSAAGDGRAPHQGTATTQVTGWRTSFRSAHHERSPWENSLWTKRASKRVFPEYQELPLFRRESKDQRRTPCSNWKVHLFFLTFSFFPSFSLWGGNGVCGFFSMWP